MTQAEKTAKELVEKFYKISYHDTWRWNEAKQCALICVNFYLKNNTSNRCIYYGMKFEDHWQEVKQAIKKL